MISNLKSGVAGNVSRLHPNKTPKSVKDFTSFFRATVSEPTVQLLFREKLIECLQSDEFKKNQLAMKLIADKMILDAAAELKSEEMKVNADNASELLELIKSRVATLTAE
ncbi:hypothetical protein [Enterovibrio calviensis]|uniref:hypothetical protein n=1 Tax=Enterovibrio calviensis TaxID=91359 RepID=UPI000487BF8B|nr:hypothetical protein [Enterovibrio calviensis]